MLKFRTVTGSEFTAFSNVVNELRGRVWQEQGAVFKQTKSDTFMVDELDNDPNTHHFFYFDDDKLIGSARLFVCSSPEEADESSPAIPLSLASLPGPYAAFSRLVVDPEYRRIGISDSLSRARIFKSFLMGVGAVCVSSVGEGRVKYWESQGFTMVGKTNQTKCMVYEIERPVFDFVGLTAELAHLQERRQGERKVA